MSLLTLTPCPDRGDPLLPRVRTSLMDAPQVKKIKTMAYFYKISFFKNKTTEIIKIHSSLVSLR